MLRRFTQARETGGGGGDHQQPGAQWLLSLRGSVTGPGHRRSTAQNGGKAKPRPDLAVAPQPSPRPLGRHNASRH
uniref:Uncharacterized protein n=1 Tax=Plectus sambesii TaxID=2011161 RepID=A0A914XQH4_9BILA